MDLILQKSCSAVNFESGSIKGLERIMMREEKNITAGQLALNCLIWGGGGGKTTVADGSAKTNLREEVYL